MSEDQEVKFGQVWADNDKRSEGRKVRIISVEATHAVVVPASAQPGHGRQTRILLTRFKPTATGYRLVSESGASDV